MNISLLRAPATAFILTLALLYSPAAQATLLVYEGYKGYSTNLGTATPNANTIGLDTSTAYTGTNVSSYVINGSSLSFGTNFATSGGSITIAGQTAVAAAKLNISPSSYTGTLFNSYLVRITNRSVATSSDGGGARVSNDTSNGTERFLAFADSRTSSTEVAVGYDSSTMSAGNFLALNTTYLILSSFTGVGSTSTGTGTTYAFTQAQYDSFIMAGGTQTVLDSLTVADGGLTAKSVDSGTVPNGFASGNYVHFVSQGNSGQFDELRYGTTLNDVLGIPEPGAGALALLGVVFLLRRRRR